MSQPHDEFRPVIKYQSILDSKTRRQNFNTALLDFFNQLNNLQGTYIV